MMRPCRRCGALIFIASQGGKPIALETAGKTYEDPGDGGALEVVPPRPLFVDHARFCGADRRLDERALQSRERARARRRGGQPA